MKDLAFYLGIGTLFTHELDSMLNHEWRVLPLIRGLPEEAATSVFVAAHIPIFAVVVALIASSNARIRTMSRIGVGLFLVLHGLLHFLFRNHPSYEFSELLSNLLIFGGSMLGIVFLALEWHERKKYAG